VKALDPPEWCNDGTRATDPAECNNAVLFFDGLFYPCLYDASDSKCKSVDDEPHTCVVPP
jgi:hypothetical protein